MESLADLYRRPGFMVKRLHQVATAIFLEECGRYNMTPSQAGVKTLHEVAPAAKRAQNRFLSALPARKRAGFLTLLHTLLDAHSAKIEPADIKAFAKVFGTRQKLATVAESGLKGYESSQ